MTDAGRHGNLPDREGDNGTIYMDNPKLVLSTTDELCTCVGVGVYFGSFDPLHENHVAVAKHAVTEYGLCAVYLVSTANRDDSKPFQTPLADRASMIDARFAESDCANILRRYQVSDRQKLDYEGRQGVCRDLIHRTRVDYARCTKRNSDEPGGQPRLPRVQVYQILGADKFELQSDVLVKSGRVLATMRGRIILVYPRTTSASPIVVPFMLQKKASSHDIRFEVVASYIDPTPELSSTRLREVLAVATTQTAVPDGIHPCVWKVAVAENAGAATTPGIYAPLQPSSCRFHATILGPQKHNALLCDEIKRRLGKDVFRHYANVDFHRAATLELESEGYNAKWLHRLKCADKTAYDTQYTRFISLCHVAAMKLLNDIGLKLCMSECPDVKQLIAFEHGHLCAFEGKQSVNVAYDVVFQLEYSDETLLQRRSNRTMRSVDSLTQPAVMDLPRHACYNRRNLHIDQYAKMRPCTAVEHIDGDQPIAVICDQMEATIRRLAEAKGLFLLRPQARHSISNAVPRALIQLNWPSDTEPLPSVCVDVAYVHSMRRAFRQLVQYAVRASTWKSPHRSIRANYYSASQASMYTDRAFLWKVTTTTWHDGGFRFLEREQMVKMDHSSNSNGPSGRRKSRGQYSQTGKGFEKRGRHNSS